MAPIQWDDAAKLQLLLRVIEYGDTKLSQQNWAAIANAMGDGVTASAVRYCPFSVHVHQYFSFVSAHITMLSTSAIMLISAKSEVLQIEEGIRAALCAYTNYAHQGRCT